MVEDYVEETSWKLKEECTNNYYNKYKHPKLRSLNLQDSYKLCTSTQNIRLSFVSNFRVKYVISISSDHICLHSKVFSSPNSTHVDLFKIAFLRFFVINLKWLCGFVRSCAKCKPFYILRTTLIY